MSPSIAVSDPPSFKCSGKVHTKPSLERSISQRHVVRRVLFAPKTKGILIRSRCDMSDAEMDAVWFTDEENAEIESEIVNTVERMRLGVVAEDNDECCTRGLEHMQTTDSFEQRSMRKLSAIDTVLNEQERQRSLGTDDPDAIARMYEDITTSARDIAMIRGATDEHCIFGVDDESDDYLPRAHKHYLPTGSSSSSFNRKYIARAKKARQTPEHKEHPPTHPPRPAATMKKIPASRHLRISDGLSRKHSIGKEGDGSVKSMVASSRKMAGNSRKSTGMKGLRTRRIQVVRPHKFSYVAIGA